MDDIFGRPEEETYIPRPTLSIRSYLRPTLSIRSYLSSVYDKEDDNRVEQHGCIGLSKHREEDGQGMNGPVVWAMAIE